MAPNPYTSDYTAGAVAASLETSARTANEGGGNRCVMREGLRVAWFGRVSGLGGMATSVKGVPLMYRVHADYNGCAGSAYTAGSLVSAVTKRRGHEGGGCGDVLVEVAGAH
jgi:hypothetical protein